MNDSPLMTHMKVTFTSVSLALVGEFPLSGIFPGLRTQRATLGAIGFEGSQSLSPTAFLLSPDVSRNFET